MSRKNNSLLLSPLAAVVAVLVILTATAMADTTTTQMVLGENGSSFGGLNTEHYPVGSASNASYALNVLYNEGDALTCRKGLFAFYHVSVTGTEGFDWLYTYTAPSGQGYYFYHRAPFNYLSALPSKMSTLSPYHYNFYPYYYNTGQAHWTAGSDYEDRRMSVRDTTAHLRARFGSGVGMSMIVGDSTFTISAILDDTTVVVDRANFSAVDSAGFGVVQELGSIRDAVVSNRTCYIGTSHGLYKFQNELIGFDTIGYEGYILDTVTVKYSSVNSNVNDVWLEWELGSNVGTETTPTTAELGHFTGRSLFICHDPIVLDTSWTIPYLRGKRVSVTYSILYATKAGSIYLHTNGVGAATVTGADSNYSDQCAIYASEIDSSTMITFDCDLIQSERVVWAGAKVTAWNTFHPADSTWDSTRFESGDWYFATEAGIADSIYGNTGGEFPIVGRVDSSGNFFVLGGPLAVDFDSTVVDSNLTCYAYRKVKKTSTGLDYKVLASYNDRFWMVRGNYPTQLVYSKPFEPENVDEYQVLNFDLENGDEIVGLQPLNGYLYLFTERSGVWQIYFSTITDNSIFRVSPSLNCRARNALILVDDAIFVMNPNGMYLYDGGQPVSISSDIDNVLDSINWQASDKITAAYYDENIWISCPFKPASENNRTLIVHVPTQRWSWCDRVAGAWFRNTDESDTNALLFGEWAGQNSFVGVYQGHYDNWYEHITMKYRTSWSDLGTPFHVKQLQNVLLSWSAYQDTTTMTLNVYRSDTLVATYAFHDPAGTQTFYSELGLVVGGNAWGNLLRFELVAADVMAETKVYQLGLRFKERGERGIK